MSFESNPQKGWYPDPEQPGRERYWDGIAWTEARRSTPQDGSSNPPPPPPGPGLPVGVPPPMGSTVYESSQVGWALGLAIAGFCCFILSIVGGALGIIELNAINAGRRDPSNKTLAIVSIVVAGVVLAFGLFMTSANVAFNLGGL